MIRNLNKIARRMLVPSALGAAVALTGGMFAGCHSIFEDSDCDSSYNLVKLTYDHNMKFADAFSAEVDRVTLLAFDASTGKLAKRIDAKRSDMTDNNEVILDVEPGEYDLLVWGGDFSSHFDLAGGDASAQTLEDYHCYLQRNAANEVNEDLADLYHGMTRVELPYASPEVPNRLTINLKKDTNRIRVVLQHLSGEPVEAEKYQFTITDTNGWLNHDNSLRDAETRLTYLPWYTHTGSVDINSNPNDAPGTKGLTTGDTRAALGASLAEFTTSRLLTSNNPVLTVTARESGETVLSIPVNDYALLVKGYGNREMSNQEYLDRQDEYNMTFFLDERGHWLSTVIIINNWRIVRHNETLN